MQLNHLPQGINMNQLPEIIKANPTYARMLTGLGQIDIFIKKVVEDTVGNYADPSIYFIKTELNALSYTLKLYNSERRATVCYQWPLETLLAECQAKVIQSDVESITKRIIAKFGEQEINAGEDNWLT